jgi:hypothetical protein
LIKSQKDASLKFHFQAKDVYLVLGGTGTLSITVDGKSQFFWKDVIDGKLTLDGDKMYHLVHASTIQAGILDLQFSPWVQVFAFTFWSK